MNMPLYGSQHADLQFVKSFLLTFTTFTNAAVLAQKLLQRYIVPSTAPVNAAAVRLRVVNVAMMWARGLGSDYEPTLASAAALQRISAGVTREGAARLAKAVQRGVARVQEWEKRQQVPSTETLKKQGTVDICSERMHACKRIDYLMQLSPGHVAVQLTVADEKLFHAIKVDFCDISCFLHVLQPWELLEQAWRRTSGRHRAPNVVASILHTDRISRLVSASIVQADNVEQRAASVCKWVQVAVVRHHVFWNFLTVYRIFEL